MREERKNRFRKKILNHTHGSDEREKQIYQHAFRMILRYIIGYTIVEIVWKTFIKESLFVSLADLVRLITTILVYVAIMADNQCFSLESERPVTWTERIKVLLPWKMDERLKKISGAAAAIAFAYHLLFLSVEVIYRIAKNDFTLIWFDYILFITMMVLVLILCGKNETFGLYKSPEGDILDGDTKSNIKERKRIYWKNSLQVCIMLAVLEYGFNRISDSPKWLEQLKGGFQMKWVSGFVHFIVVFLVQIIAIYGVNYFLGEHAVKKYDRKLDDMDE